MDSNFENKVVIVTGGAGHIGAAITRSFLRAGANVVICGRRAPAEPIRENDREAVFLQADIRDPAQAESVIDRCVERFGRLDVLVNNAGGTPPVSLADCSPELINKIIQLNLVSPLVLARKAQAAMALGGGQGNIINIASVSGARPSPGTTPYGAAKAGLINATRSLAMEWGPSVRVNAIVVGLVHHDAGVEHYGGEEGFRRVAEMLPLKRMADPSDIANACLYLASEMAAYVSGATLEVDGGGEVPVFLHLAEQSAP